MKLESVDIQNFRSIGNVRLNLDNRGLVLIQGINLDKDDGSSNGAAKSSLTMQSSMHYMEELRVVQLVIPSSIIR